MWTKNAMVLAGDGKTTLGGHLAATDTRKVHQISDSLIVGVAGRTGLIYDGGSIDLVREVPIVLKAMDWSNPLLAVEEFKSRLGLLLRRMEGVNVVFSAPWIIRVIVAGRSQSGFFGFELKAEAIQAVTLLGTRVRFGPLVVTSLRRPTDTGRWGINLLTPRTATEADLRTVLQDPATCKVVETPALCNFVANKTNPAFMPWSLDALQGVARDLVAFTAIRDPDIGGTTTTVSVAVPPPSRAPR